MGKRLFLLPYLRRRQSDNLFSATLMEIIPDLARTTDLIRSLYLAACWELMPDKVDEGNGKRYNS